MTMMRKGIEILLVEDNPDDVELTLDALAENHVSNDIHVVRDGAEALDFLFRQGAYLALQGDPPKLILLDLKLPKIDGLEVLQKLKSDPRTQKIAVVILTSSRQERDVVRGYELGVNSYIVKPVDFEQFNAAVKTLGLYWMVINEFPPPHA